MNKSILTTIKRLLGIEEEYTHFDLEIITHINSTLMVLRQMGVGPIEGFSIEGSTEVWSDFIDEIQNFEAVKTYIFMRVKLAFDPPTSSSQTEIFKSTINELEWRLNATAETHC